MTLEFDEDQAVLLAASERSEMPDVRDELALVRSRLEAAADLTGAEVAGVHDHVVDGPHRPLRIRRYSASLEPNQAAVVFFHGGGMVLSSIDRADALCRQMCADSGATVFSVDYRLAPEHKYPVATEEAFFATEWVARNGHELGVDATRLAVMGDSAGGSLAAGVTLQARDAGGPSIALQVLIYPGLERSTDRPSMLAFADGPAVTRANLDWMKEQYLGPDASTDTPYGVPALAEDLSGLPEAIIVVAAVDPLTDGVEEYAQRLFQAGVQTTVMRYPGVIHGFLSHLRHLGRAQRCVRDMASAVQYRLSLAQRETTGS